MKKTNSSNILLGMIAIAVLIISGASIVGSVEPEDNFRASGIIRGYVSDSETGDIIIDAEIELNNLETDHHYVDYSDDNGSYEFDGLMAGDYGITAYKRGYYSFRDNIALEEGQTLHLDISLKPYECSVSGYLYDQISGDPIEEGTSVRIEGYDENGDYYSSNYYPDPDAFYIFGLLPGDYELDASGYKYNSGYESVRMSDGDHVERDFHLEPICSISGVVYNVETDEPVSEILVELLRNGPMGLAYIYDEYTTDISGCFHFIVEPDRYTVRIREDGYKHYHETYSVEEGDHIDHDVYLEVDYAVLSGYIHDSTTGEAVKNATVSVYNYDSGYETSTVTDEDGYYVTYPGSGESSITVRKEGYKDDYDTVIMEEDTPRELDFRLEPYTSTIYGTIYDQDTLETVGDAYIQLSGDDYYEITMSDENGEYLFYLDGGKYDIWISAEGYSTYKETITIEDGVAYQFDVELSPYDSTVFGYITDADGNPISGAYVRISSDYYDDTYYPLRDGYYEFVLPPSEESGEYTLRVTADGYRDHEESFWLEPGDELQIDVEMQEQWSPGSVWRWIWELIFG